jgi:hypothetical protein
VKDDTIQQICENKELVDLKRKMEERELWNAEMKFSELNMLLIIWRW